MRRKMRLTPGALRLLLTGFLSLFLVGTIPEGGLADTRSPADGALPGRILVKYRDDVGPAGAARARSRAPQRGWRRFRHLGMEEYFLPPGQDLGQARALLEGQPEVEFVEYVYRATFLAMPTLTPSEPDLPLQWSLNKAPLARTFQDGSPISIDVDMDAPEGWRVMAALFDPSEVAVVAVIDSGMGEAGFFSDTTGYIPNHVDLLTTLLFVNPGEAGAFTDGADTDLNGLDDDINGYDWFTVDEGIPEDEVVGPDNIPADVWTGTDFHGTIISGIVGAAWNSTGMAGISPDQLRIVPLRAQLSTDIYEAFDAVIGYAAADTSVSWVINASWSFSTNLSGLETAVRSAGAAGVAVVAAAGNSAGNNDDVFNRIFPAEYAKDPTIGNVLAVAAADSTGTLAPFSNYGPGSVQVAAPGVDIYSASRGTNQYAFADGTSFAAPAAAALVALVMENYGLTPAGAMTRVMAGGDFDARLAGRSVSGKRVNLAGALAPFAPYSGLAEADAVVPVSMYADSDSLAYGTIVSVLSNDPAVAQIFTTSASSFAISPIKPGIAGFTIGFGGASAPSGTYDTGPWRVTGITPFTARVPTGDTITFTSLLGGTPSWSVIDSTVGTIDGTGTFTALTTGLTQVVLNIDGSPTDNTGIVLVVPAGAGNGGDGGGGGGCFIATATYGSGMAGEVQELRRFRDAFLLASDPGRRLVEAYYRYAPGLAGAIADNEGLKAIVRTMLKPVVAGASWSVHGTKTAPAY